MAWQEYIIYIYKLTHNNKIMDNLKDELKELKTRLEELEDRTDPKMTEMYDEMLDETLEPFSLNGMNYDPSRVLREVDPIAYRVGFDDFVSNEISDVEYEIEELEKCIKVKKS